MQLWYIKYLKLYLGIKKSLNALDNLLLYKFTVEKNATSNSISNKFTFLGHYYV